MKKKRSKEKKKSDKKLEQEPKEKIYVKKDIKQRLKEEHLGRKKARKKEKRARKFLKFNKTKIKIFSVIVIISILLQWWEYNTICIKIVCSPLIIGTIYYLFWPFQLLNILILGSIPPNQIVLSIAKIIFIVLQIAYWYIISCLIAIPINTVRGKVGRTKSRKRKSRDKAMKEQIAKDIKIGEEMEKEKHLEKLKKEVKVLPKKSV